MLKKEFSFYSYIIIYKQLFIMLIMLLLLITTRDFYKIITQISTPNDYELYTCFTPHLNILFSQRAGATYQAKKQDNCKHTNNICPPHKEIIFFVYDN